MIISIQMLVGCPVDPLLTGRFLGLELFASL